MPRVAMDFSKTVIYHFVCNDEMIKCSYVGSTTNFVRRKYHHKSTCNNENSKDYHIKVYQTIRENGGWINWDMKPLEEFCCENKTQQVIREQYWIDKLKPELNCCKAYREGENQKEKNKAYYILNLEVIAEKSKVYREANPKVITERKKAWYEANKKAIAEKGKAYREANPEVIAEKNKAYYKANAVVLAEYKRAWYEAKKLKKEQETEQ